MPKPVDKFLEKSKETDYYGILFKDLDIKSFLKKQPREVYTHMAAELSLPDIAPKTGDSPEKPKEDMAPPTPPKESTPTPKAEPKTPPIPEPPKEDPRVDKLMSEIEVLKKEILELKGLGGAEGLRQLLTKDMEKFYKELKSDIEHLEDRKTPERGTFDTEGAYREHLYGMAVRMLDDFIPELVDEIPDYSFIASQVSRLYEDGTVADGLLCINISVPRGDSKYDFKVDIPVLNGLLHYPMYLQRGQKLIPLTKSEIQEE